MSDHDLLTMRLRAGAVVPFVGAGVSRAVERTDGSPAFVSWHELLLEMAHELERKGRSKYATLIRGHLEAPADYLSAADVAQSNMTTEQWHDVLRSKLDVRHDQIRPGSLALAAAVWKLSRFVITTNYDDVLSWTAPGRASIINIQDSTEALIAAINNAVTKPTVWHLHGHVRNLDSLVLGPRSYEGVYTPSNGGHSEFEAARTVLRTLLAARSLLFIGFSLDDPYVSEQLEAVARVFQKRGGPHFALLRAADVARKKTQLESLGVVPIPYEDHGEPLLHTIRSLAGALARGPAHADRGIVLANAEDGGGAEIDHAQVSLAERYLEDRSSEISIEAVRARAAGRRYRAAAIDAALLSPTVAERVAAHAILQMAPSARASRLFPVALLRELSAAAAGEPRPLEQLALAIHTALEAALVPPEQLPGLHGALDATHDVLAASPTRGPALDRLLDRLRELIERAGRIDAAELSEPAAEAQITRYARQAGLYLLPGVRREESVTGTIAYVQDELDRLGLVYCYASGAEKGRVAWTRKGIALGYRRHALRTQLGFPLGREETIDGGAVQRFELGYMEWKRDRKKEVRAYRGALGDRSQMLGPPLRV